jgi:hypothetical protein
LGRFVVAIVIVFLFFILLLLLSLLLNYVRPKYTLIVAGIRAFKQTCSKRKKQRRTSPGLVALVSKSNCSPTQHRTTVGAPEWGC